MGKVYFYTMCSPENTSNCSSAITKWSININSDELEKLKQTMRRCVYDFYGGKKYIAFCRKQDNKILSGNDSDFEDDDCDFEDDDCDFEDDNCENIDSVDYLQSLSLPPYDVIQSIYSVFFDDSDEAKQLCFVNCISEETINGINDAVNSVKANKISPDILLNLFPIINLLLNLKIFKSLKEETVDGATSLSDIDKENAQKMRIILKALEFCYAPEKQDSQKSFTLTPQKISPNHNDQNETYAN